MNVEEIKKSLHLLLDYQLAELDRINARIKELRKEDKLIESKHD